MAMVKWWKVYHYYGLRNTEITHQLNLFQSQQGKPYQGALIPLHLISNCSNEFYPSFSSEILNNNALSCIQHVVENLESSFLISDCPILSVTDADFDAEKFSFAMENKENNDEESSVQSATQKSSRCQLLSQCHLTDAVQNARAPQQPVSINQVALSYRDTFSRFSECYKVVENNPIIHAKLNEKLDEIHSFLLRELVNNQQGQGGGQIVSRNISHKS
jgi:hypothetical protein